MTCVDDTTIVAFLDGTLDEASHVLVDTELDTCESCRELLAAVARDWHENRSFEFGVVAIGSAVGRYVIEALLGAGAMGVVYRAYDPVVARRVALKLMDIGSFADSDAVLREARTMGRVDHRAVVRIYDAGVTTRHVYVAMELVEGQTLRELIGRDSMSARAWYQLFASLAAGMAAAHDAGVVHRDFKPENVLVAADGTPRITDFGLARSNAPLESTSLGSLGTHPAGTPAYMAPEQLLGGTTDERSDQYSFAVTMYEAITGKRPIVASSLDELLTGMRSHVMDWSQVSRGLRALLERALALEPELRHASMHDIARALRMLASPPRWPKVVGVATIVVLGVAAGAAAVRSPSADPCTAADGAVATAWPPGRGALVEQAFAKTRRPYAAHLGLSARRELDTYAATLRAAYVSACRDTRSLHTRSEELMDRRILCLDRAVADLDATSALFERADATIVDNSPSALRALTSLASCLDLSTLADQIPVPSDKAVRARIVTVQRQLAEAKATLLSADFSAGITLGTSVVATANEIGYRPLEAEALFGLGTLRYVAGDTTRARADLEAAALAAVAGRSRFLEARIREQLAQLHGLSLRSPRDAEAQLALGFALLETMTGAELLVEELHKTRGAILAIDGDHAGALAIFQNSLARLPEHERSRRADLYQLIANAQIGLGRTSEAVPLLEQSLDLARTVVGEEHPLVASLFENLADALQESAPARSLEYMKQAHAIQVRVFPAGSPKIATTEANLGGILLVLGRADEALPYLQRALDVQVRTIGVDHPGYAMTLVTSGRALRLLQRLDAALAATEEGERVLLARFGEAHLMVAIARGERGMVLAALRRHREAVSILEVALDVQQAQHGSPDEVAELQFELAQALWARDRNSRTRVSELLGAAELGFLTIEKLDLATHVATWRVRHGL
ncbi:MAG: protein kinase domain-containing protein [Kofleriaceae bacterium]